MAMQASWMNPSDLAPGDRKALESDWRHLDLHCVESAKDPAFATAYAALWQEFGTAGEMERADILERRLALNPRSVGADCSLIYSLMLLTANGELVAVRDHTVILREESIVIHLSHNLIAPNYRRTGLAGWLRSLPIFSARSVASAKGENLPVTLVAEMEPADETPKRAARLMAYEKAGFRKIDPRRISYFQPDFRSAGEIDASGGAKPIPLSLVVRRVGRETEDHLSGNEIRNIVESLYLMYGADVRAVEMAPLIAGLSSYPGEDENVALVAPTAKDAV